MVSLFSKISSFGRPSSIFEDQSFESPEVKNKQLSRGIMFRPL